MDLGQINRSVVENLIREMAIESEKGQFVKKGREMAYSQNAFFAKWLTVLRKIVALLFLMSSFKSVGKTIILSYLH